MQTYLFAALLSVSAVLWVPDLEDPGRQDLRGQDLRGQGRGGQDPMAQVPDLEGALRKTEGCLGVETAQTSTRKQVIFAWFEDKAAVLRWYHGPTHQQVMRAFTYGENELKEPLEHIEGGTGPIMVIASLTMDQRPKFEGLSLPVSQIAIELYQPLPGGTYLGGRFTPKEVPVPHSRDMMAEKKDR